ncbi:hypothetical protein [Nocardioides panzhihuensis]|uniref:Uncharacterized protein n=1 Tax=Nocardioides panzhihuensis TaxID=860243 RepID=A0A7Z0DRP8_9ACTN|nr:hypothetical protein [Nocardioides panzhihuensis]NYI80187.1 hypothetical protein [Nocardioides panzhihuensis]
MIGLRGRDGLARGPVSLCCRLEILGRFHGVVAIEMNGPSVEVRLGKVERQIFEGRDRVTENVQRFSRATSPSQE